MKDTFYCCICGKKTTQVFKINWEGSKKVIGLLAGCEKCKDKIEVYARTGKKC